MKTSFQRSRFRYVSIALWSLLHAVACDAATPVAYAGLDQTSAVGSVVQLDGSGSVDTDGPSLNYTWSLAVKPAGSQTVLSDPKSPRPTLRIDAPGRYVIQLIVNDGASYSVADQLIVSTDNSPPVAKAGMHKTVAVGSTALLDGSGSYDVDGDRLSFRWSIVSRPAASKTAVSDAAAPRINLPIDAAGQYVVQLIVSDGSVDSVADQIVLSTSNSRPMANAGADRTAAVGTQVQLNGSASFDPDGSALSYRWTLVYRPPLSKASLSNITAATPMFALDQAGTYVAQLLVSDGTLQSAPDTVVIETDNSAPRANAGLDQTASTAQSVQLAGCGSADPDGDVLTYRWSLSYAPLNSQAILAGTDGCSPAFTPDLAGLYIAQLSVGDGHFSRVIDTVAISVSQASNRAPVAQNDLYSAVSGKTLSIAAPGVLGNDSDPEGRPLTAELVSAPTSGTLQLATNGSFSYTPPIGFAGAVNFNYRAFDQQARSNIATAVIDVKAATTTTPTPAPVVDTSGATLYDGADGLTAFYFNRGAQLKWSTPGGDHGTKFAEVTVTGTVVDVDITALVQRWIAQGNTGLLIRAKQGATTFYSRESASPPALIVDGQTYRATADAPLNTSTTASLGAQDRYVVGANVAMQFALPKQCQKAVLRLNVAHQYSGPSTILEVFELKPPPAFAFLSSDVRQGTNPQVYMQTDFSQGWQTKFSTVFVAGMETVVDPLLGSVLRGKIPAGQNNGMNTLYTFRQKGTAEPEELYFRYYLMLEENFKPIDGGKLPGISAHLNAVGFGGNKPTGADGWSMRGLFEPAMTPGNPYSRYIPTGSYAYHVDQATTFGDHLNWSGGLLERGRWYSIEHHIRLNTPGQKDGLYEGWIDGKLAFRRTDLRWRTVPELKIQAVWLNMYHGGLTPPAADHHFRIGKVVIAKGYIGPLSTAPAPAPSPTPSPAPTTPPSTGTLPSWVPAAGEIRAINLNTLADVDVCPQSNCSFSGNMVGNSGVLHGFTHGVFNPYYSNLGALHVHGGGHLSYYGNEVYAFNLDTRKWDPAIHTPAFRIASPPLSATQDAYFSSQWGEHQPINPANGAEPCAPHSYDSQAIVPPELGGGTKGSFIVIAKMFCHRNGDGGSWNTHALDLSSGRWRRYSDQGTAFPNLQMDGYAWDPVRRRWWWWTKASVPYGIPYLQANANGTATHQIARITDPRLAFTTRYGTGAYWPKGDLVLSFGYDSRYATTGHAGLMIIDPKHPEAGVRWARLVGVNTATFLKDIKWWNWGFTYVPDGDFFVIKGSAPALFYKLTPPAPEQWLTGEWRIEAFPRATGIVDDDIQVYAGGAGIGKRFAYVPKLRSIIWTHTRKGPVYCWRVPGI